jgi:hypothetical protein
MQSPTCANVKLAAVFPPIFQGHSQLGFHAQYGISSLGLVLPCAYLSLQAFIPNWHTLPDSCRRSILHITF